MSIFTGIKCDECGKQFSQVTANSVKELREAARKSGWHCGTPAVCRGRRIHEGRKQDDTCAECMRQLSRDGMLKFQKEVMKFVTPEKVH